MKKEKLEEETRVFKGYWTENNENNGENKDSIICIICK
jgi:hypothetical protein